MNIDVSHIARLAHLSFTGEELIIMKEDMTRLVEMVAELPENDIQPGENSVDAMELRKDEVIPSGLSKEEILGNAPETEHGFFVVPKTVE